MRRVKRFDFVSIPVYEEPTFFLLFSLAKYSWNCLLYCRLVHCGKQLSLASGTDVHIFSTRTGTKQGVESHTFRVESQRDQAMWCKALVNGAHESARIVQEVTCGKCLF